MSISLRTLPQEMLLSERPPLLMNRIFQVRPPPPPRLATTVIWMESSGKGIVSSCSLGGKGPRDCARPTGYYSCKAILPIRPSRPHESASAPPSPNKMPCLVGREWACRAGGCLRRLRFSKLECTSNNQVSLVLLRSPPPTLCIIPMVHYIRRTGHGQYKELCRAFLTGDDVLGTSISTH